MCSHFPSCMDDMGICCGGRDAKGSDVAGSDDGDRGVKEVSGGKKVDTI